VDTSAMTTEQVKMHFFRCSLLAALSNTHLWRLHLPPWFVL